MNEEQQVEREQREVPQLGFFARSYAVVSVSYVDTEPEVDYVELVILDVPTDLPKTELKTIIELSGRAPAAGGNLWQGYALLKKEDWDKFGYGHWGWDGANEEQIITDGRAVGYLQLLEEIKSEKRITLRMQLVLHSILSQEASKAGLSLNEHCIRILKSTISEGDKELVDLFDPILAQPGGLAALKEHFQAQQEAIPNA